jgi:hypothetical protein
MQRRQDGDQCGLGHLFNAVAADVSGKRSQELVRGLVECPGPAKPGVRAEIV